MKETISRHGHLFAAVVAMVALMALLLQYALLVGATSDASSASQATVRFLSYFTILANVLVACTAGSAVFDRDGQGMFARAGVRGAVALYIGVTGIIYTTVLRHLWQPQGAQWWADTGLHYAGPVLYLTWWLLVQRHGALRWRDATHWLLFPLAYALWTFVRGDRTGEYPYPFVDVGVLGMATVLRNAVAMLVLFLVLGLLLVGLDRWLGRRRSLPASA